MKKLIEWKKAQNDFKRFGDEIAALEKDYNEKRLILEHHFADAHQALRDTYKALSEMKLEECDEGPGKLRPANRRKGRR